jgi:zinc transport system substrate-binding protein
MILIILLTAGCSKISNEDAQNTSFENLSEEKIKFVTSFYPIYIMMLNITDGASGVEVVNMSETHTGCLHDFQIQPEDLKNIETSTAFIINGAGMEPFVEKILQENPNIKIVDSSKGIELILSDGHENHSHEEEEEEDHHHEYNPHIWVSISNYIQQIENITDEIINLDPNNADIYELNCNTYIKNLEQLSSQMHEKIDNLPNKNIVTFHEAFPYFAKEFSLNVVGVINQNPHSKPSAKEIADTINKIKQNNVKALFVEPQYLDNLAENIASETNSQIFVLDPAVTGDKSKDCYINTMRKNMQTLVEALSHS